MRTANYEINEWDRFWNKVLVGDGCWEWIAGRNAHGYGTFAPTGKKSGLAHRWAYAQLVGPIAEGLTIDHLCRNRGCVKPGHLQAVTHKENVMRGEGLAARFARRTTCKEGHPLDGVETRGGYRMRFCTTCRRAYRNQYKRTTYKRKKATHG